MITRSAAERWSANRGGYFSGDVPGASAGALYRFVLDGEGPFPDPASRFQPDGPDGASRVEDPAFPRSDSGWTGPELAGQAIYELHIGTFTPEGTWAAAARELPWLADIVYPVNPAAST